MGGARKTDSVIDGHLTLFDELHENRVVPADGQPKAILIFLNDHASLNQPWRKGENKRREKLSYESSYETDFTGLPMSLLKHSSEEAYQSRLQ